MRDTIDMAREAGAMFDHMMWLERDLLPVFQRFEALVRADEREQGQKWFDAVTAQHKQMILAEREACARVCEAMNKYMDDGEECAAAIRARSKDEK